MTSPDSNRKILDELRKYAVEHEQKYGRFPKTLIHFHNEGTMGDRAADSFKRFEADVAAYKPHYVSVLFGMNDGNFTDWQQPIFEVFQKDMTTLFDRIVELGATPIPMTPTTFDPLSIPAMSRFGMRCLTSRMASSADVARPHALIPIAGRTRSSERPCAESRP